MSEKTPTVPEVEDVTGQGADPKPERVSKTKIARDAAIDVLKTANRPMRMDEIVAEVMQRDDVQKSGAAKGTISAQINFELAEKSPRIVRVARAVYAAKGVRVPKNFDPKSLLPSARQPGDGEGETSDAKVEEGATA